MKAGAEPTPVIVLSGFLGAGKSTLLKALMERPGCIDTALVINEFGDVAIDHDLVVHGRPELVVTTTGCVCCVAGSDVRSSLFKLSEARRLAQIPEFSRVIIETTGLADLAPVVNQIVPGGAPATGLRDHVVARNFRLAGVVTVVDAIHADATLAEHFECLKQIAFADRLIFTKTDGLNDPASRRDLDELRARLRSINPAARIYDRQDPDFDLESVFAPRTYVPTNLGEDVNGWLAIDSVLASASPAAHDASTAQGRHKTETTCLISDAPFARKNFRTFMSLLNLALGPNLLRLKGIVAFEDDPDRPVVIHAVQYSVHPERRLEEWPSEDKRSRLVAITAGVDGVKFQQMFQSLTSQDEPKRQWQAAMTVMAVAVFAGIVLVGGIGWATTYALSLGR